jgi:hypothetical protein
MLTGAGLAQIMPANAHIGQSSNEDTTDPMSSQTKQKR